MNQFQNQQMNVVSLLHQEVKLEMIWIFVFFICLVMQHTTSSSTVATASSNTNTLFVIVGKEDRLLYSFEYSDTKVRAD
jgi:hypothetical protein